MSTELFCNECGFIIEKATTELLMKNVTRYKISGFSTLRMTRRMKRSGMERSESVPLFHAYNVGLCSSCGKPMRFVKENDDTHLIIDQPRLK